MGSLIAASRSPAWQRPSARRFPICYLLPARARWRFQAVLPSALFSVFAPSYGATLLAFFPGIINCDFGAKLWH
ncbi:MAG: hypothetical protein ACLUI3_15240 [Christensenellales bacterium]